MKKFSFSRVMACAVACVVSVAVNSCVNSSYELSEENLDLNVTVFQEGVSLPLGSTAKITLESLYARLDEETKEYLKCMDGAYGLYLSGEYDMTDSFSELKSSLAIEAVDVQQEYKVNLSSVDLSSLEIPEQKIGPKTVDIASMLDIPDFTLPVIGETFNVSASMERPEVGSLALDFPQDIKKDYEFASLAGNGVTLPDIFIDNNAALLDQEMDYEQLQSTYPTLSLPALTVNKTFGAFTTAVPVHLELPDMIKGVRSIKLHDDARFELTISMKDPLFTSGKVIPSFDMDLHNLFHIDYVMSGIENEGQDVHPDDLLQHIEDRFVLAPSDDPQKHWRASHVYHIDSLSIDPEKDWQHVGDKLVLDKTIEVTFGPKEGDEGLKTEELKTTLRYLHEHMAEHMGLTLEVRFLDVEVDNVKMEIDVDEMLAEMKVDKTMSIDVPSVTLPEMVERVDYVTLGQDLQLSIDPVVPAELASLGIGLKELKVEFPEGLVVDRTDADKGVFNAQERTLTYNVPLSGRFEDKIRISRLNLPAPVNGSLSYAGEVKVTAVPGISNPVINSKDILGGSGDLNLKADIDVAFAPALTDFSVATNDYKYSVAEQFTDSPLSIKEPLPDEVKELAGTTLTAWLESVDGKNPEIVVNLDYPESDKLRLLPDAEKGLALSFPTMIKFGELPQSYGYDPVNNSITFAGDTEIPRRIVLPLSHLAITPEYDETDGKYYVKGEMQIEGGVRIPAATWTKGDIDELKAAQAKFSFDAAIPLIKPVKLGMDEYATTFDETFDIDGFEFEGLPTIIKSIENVRAELDNVYLDFEIDVKSVLDIVEDVDLTLDAEITLPAIFDVEGAENNRLPLEGSLDRENGKFTFGRIHVKGVDLSSASFEDGKVSVGKQSVAVHADVRIADVKVDLTSFDNIIFGLKGGIATEGSEEIKISNIKGNIGLDIEPFDETIDLSEYSSLLNGDNMSLTADINTFYLALTVDTNLDIPVQGELVLTPYFGDQPGEEGRLELDLDPETRTDEGYKIFISNYAPGSAGANGAYDLYEDYDYKNLDLTALLYKEVDGKQVMADNIRIAASAGVPSDKECLIEPSKDYRLSLDYAAGIPVAFGEEFVFEYRDTLAGIPQELGQILKYGSVGLGGVIENSLPFNMKLSVRLLDSQEKEIPMKAQAGRLNIRSCDASGNPRKSNIELTASIDEDVDASDVSAIELVFTADSKDAVGVPLSQDSFLRVEKLYALIPEGVTIDAGSILFQKDDASGEESESENNE